uniref:NADH-ubiquinone oxidoreductase chain 2 n=1 Tax=Macrolepiota fuliginosa TaxID=201230 RepID=A0A5Q0N4P2_9AGAR|nr:NADH dehydrogenase subunit 2 [Macrolepiota fuliginosa]QFZ98757.1 NADH dehydrogenase subunit 2 [Macrolepiota fuliginosa]
MIFTSILILIVAKALPSINRNLSPIYFTRISSIIFLYAGVLSLNTLYIQSIGSGIGIYSGLFQITQVSVLIESFLLIIGSLILISWPNINQYIYSNHNNIMHTQQSWYPRLGSSSGSSFASKSKDYSLIVLFSSLGSCLLISSFDLISLYISIELQSFGLYVLSTLYRDSESSTKAGLKYFLLGGLSSCIILLGCGIIYSYTGLTNFESIYSIISTSNSLIYCPGQDLLNNSVSLSYSFAVQGLSLGLILIFIGFLFKIAAAPLHNWSPDVYDEVPTIVTIWLTIIPKISILVLLLELQYYGFTIITSDALLASGQLLKNLLLISSLLSLLIGTVVGLAQTRIKRLLAYSTISHIGFILLALAINSESSIDSLIFYIIQYTITNLNIFLIIMALSYITAKAEIKDIRYIAELKGKFFSNPILSLSLAICLFSMAGIPPLIGFFSKQFVLYSAIQNGYYFIAIIAILVSVISASYYLKIVKVLAQSEAGLLQSNTKTVELENNYLSNVHSYLISVLTLFILLFILKPSLILNSTQLLSLSLFNW